MNQKYNYFNIADQKVSIEALRTRFRWLCGGSPETVRNLVLWGPVWRWAKEKTKSKFSVSGLISFVYVSLEKQRKVNPSRKRKLTFWLDLPK